MIQRSCWWSIKELRRVKNSGAVYCCPSYSKLESCSPDRLIVSRLPAISMRISGSGFCFGNNAISWISLYACFKAFFWVLIVPTISFRSSLMISCVLSRCSISINGSWGAKSLMTRCLALISSIERNQGEPIKRISSVSDRNST